MYFGIHLSESVIFDLRIIPIIIVTIFSRHMTSVLLVGLGIGFSRLTFGITEAAWVGMANMLLLSLAGMLLLIAAKNWSFERKTLYSVLLLNLFNVCNIALLGVMPPAKYWLVVFPTAFPASVLISLLLVWMLRDLIEEYFNKLDLLHKANQDPLTKVYNRRALMHYYRQMLSSSSASEPMSVAFIDLDYFKKVNDDYGHVIGDRVLQEISQLIKRNLRDIDVVVRYGGEEFVVLLPYCNRDDALNAVERIREYVENHPIHVNELQIPVTISAGIASSSGSKNQDLIAKADEAVYKAKHNGRNRVEIA